MALTFEDALMLDPDGYVVVADDGDRRVTFFLSAQVATTGMGFVASENEHLGSAVLHHTPQIHRACEKAYLGAPEGHEPLRLNLTLQHFQ